MDRLFIIRTANATKYKQWKKTLQQAKTNLAENDGENSAVKKVPPNEKNAERSYKFFTFLNTTTILIVFSLGQVNVLVTSVF